MSKTIRMGLKEKSIINAGWTGDFVVCDTESTGFSANDFYGKLIQVSAVKARLIDSDGSILELPEYDDGPDNSYTENEFNSFVDPEMWMKPCKKHPEPRKAKLPKKIVELTGIQSAQVWSAPPAKEVLADFQKFIGSETVMVYHNAPHDVALMHHFGIKRSLSFHKYPTIDTCPLAKYLWPEFGEEYEEQNKDVPAEERPPGPYKLETLAGKFGILDEHHHNGFNDCVVTIKLFRLELLELAKRGELNLVFDYSTLPVYAIDDDSDVDIQEPNTWVSGDGNIRRLYVTLVRTSKKGSDYSHVYYDFGRDEWSQNPNPKFKTDFKVGEFDSVHRRLMNILGLEDWTFENVKFAVQKVRYSLDHGYNGAYGVGKAKAELKKNPQQMKVVNNTPNKGANAPEELF